MKLTKQQLAQHYAQAKIVETVVSEANTIAPLATHPPLVQFEIVHNVTSNPPLHTLHILVLPANRVTPSRYTTLDNIADEYMPYVQQALLQFMHANHVTVSYAEPKYTRNAKTMRGMFTKAHLAVTRNGALT